MIDRDLLARIPAPTVLRNAAIARGIADSVAYLGSDAALRSLELDVYWPKWHSPWWHMRLLHELDEAAQIPARAVEALVAGLDRLPFKQFTVPGTVPPGIDGYRDATCHCALGTAQQLFAACGIDADAALPWTTPWFARYQMADGGLNCDDDAYTVTGESPSSMVGTIALFEARIGGADRDGAGARAAQFLIARTLDQGSPTVHNAAERDTARSWPQLAFPRFYLYDTLRGLTALVRWAEATGTALPADAIAGVVGRLAAEFPDGVVRIGRRVYAGHTTLIPTADRAPVPRQPASTFPLLEAVSVVGAPSEALTREWTVTRRALVRLLDAGRITA